MEKKSTFKRFGNFFKKLFPVLFLMAFLQNQASAQYCTPSVINCSFDDNIQNVTFAGINNSSSPVCSAGAYGNFTALAPANVTGGVTYPISVFVGPGGTEYVGVWIDYNQNTTFETSEFTAIGSAASSGTGALITGSITIPAGATAGITRMRVRVQYNTPVLNTQSCTQTSGFGEVEDYRVNIAAATPCAGTPNPGATVSSVNSACPTIAFNLSLTNIVAGSGVTYQWQSSPTGAAGSYTNIGGATSSTYSATLTASTFYQCIVTCSGSGVSTTSTPKQVLLTPPSQCYCTPTASTFGCNSGDVITNVTIGGINNTSACPTTTVSGYSNYTTTVASGTVLSGAANPISVNFPGGFTEFVAVWIDYNQSGTFDAAEYTLLGSSAAGGPLTGNIVVPASALSGPTRMRVKLNYAAAPANNSACTGSGFGEIEDYAVNITPCTPAVITAAPVSNSVICGGTATYTVATTGSLPTFSWQYRTSPSGLWTTVPAAAPYGGTNTATLTVNPVDASYNGYQYRALVTGACSAIDFSAAATLTVTPITLSISPSTITKCLSAAPVLISAPSTQSVVSFTNSTPGTCVDGDLAGISRSVTVSGVTGPIQKVRVKINALSSYIGDMVISLKAPNGQVVNLDYLLNRTNNGPSGPSPAPPGPADGFINTIFNLNRVLRGTPPTGGVVSPAAQGIDQFNSPYTAEFPIDNQSTTFFVGVPSGATGFAATTNNIGTFYAHSPVTAANGVWTLAMYDAGPPDAQFFKDFTLEITYGGAPATVVFTPSTGLFTNAAGTTPYTGNAVTQVYAAPTSNTTYSSVISAGACSAAAQNIVVNVNQPVGGTATLTNATICAGGNTSFTLGGTLTGGPAFSHNYQVSTDNGVTYTNITNGGVYSGANTPTLVLTAAPVTYNGYKFRDSINTGGNCGALISTVGTLTVNPTPVVTISAAPIVNLFPGLTTTLTAAVSPNAAASYKWYRNGVEVTGATANKYIVTIDTKGTYNVAVTDVNGCSASAGTSTPASIAIGDSANTNQLFIYPSPNNGTFQVRYYTNTTDGSAIPGGVSIYDERGAKVFSQTYSVGAGYQAMNVVLPANITRGIYRVDLVDTNGGRIKTGSVFIYR